MIFFTLTYLLSNKAFLKIIIQITSLKHFSPLKFIFFAFVKKLINLISLVNYQQKLSIYNSKIELY